MPLCPAGPTPAVLQDLRALLQSSLRSAEAADVFSQLFASWSYSCAASLSLALLAQVAEGRCERGAMCTVVLAGFASDACIASRLLPTFCCALPLPAHRPTRWHVSCWLQWPRSLYPCGQRQLWS